MKALHRKAFRDLWQMRGQALAIALVIAAGVALLVMAQATLQSLRDTQAQLYAEQRFSDVWVTLKRAPQSLAAHLSEIDGVAEVETRVVTGAKLAVRGFDEPVQALMQSLPKHQNLLYLRAGRLPQAPDEVLIGDAFAQAHGFAPGERLRATVQGRAQWFTVSGIAVSAEHLYQVQPGSPLPDFLRYTVVWMPEDTLAAALDMRGAFNQAVLRVTDAALIPNVIRALDAQLARYGAGGATARKDQISHAILQAEFTQLGIMARFFPAIFLGVAAFLLNMVFKRLIALQREQIAILKAFGYGTLQVAAHYALIVSLMTLAGAAIGVALGAWMGQGLAAMYQASFHFPYLHFRLDAKVALIGTAVSLLAAWGGTAYAVMAAAREPVAQAMRPPAPARFRQSLLDALGLSRLLSQPTRMIWRQLARRPWKAAFTVLALAFAAAILMLAQFQRASIEFIGAVEFRLNARYDLAVTFADVRPRRVLHELQSIEGVEAAEGSRSVAVRFSHGQYVKSAAIEGLAADGQLRVVKDQALRTVTMPAHGLILDDYLAELLHVQAGDQVWAEVLEGRRRQLSLPVVQRMKNYSGLTAYMDIDALNRALGDDNLINRAYLVVRDGEERAVQHHLDRRPQILGLEARSAGLAALYKMLDDNLGVFAAVVLVMGLIVNIGILYNTMRMNLSERSRELASLRVLGFRKSEISYILFGEIALLVILAIPLGLVIGYGLIFLIANGMQSEIYRIPLVVYPTTYSYVAVVTLASAALSALAIYHRIHRLNLIEVLKTRE